MSDMERARELADMADHVMDMQVKLLQSQSEMITFLQTHIVRLEGTIIELKSIMGVLDHD